MHNFLNRHRIHSRLHQ